jgi:UDP-N-acetylglucosamine kinase
VVCLSEARPVSIFMAGSPGAGKTEFSKRLLKELKIKAVRIDADEIRDSIPFYNKHNANDIQAAAALGVEYVHDYALKKNKNLLLDATFADFAKSLENVKRSISRGRHVEIYYVFQKPLIAWMFAKAREETEGRNVPRRIFIDSFLKAKENVNRVKCILGNKIILNVVVKDYKNDVERTKSDVISVDRFLESSYDYSQLEKII